MEPDVIVLRPLRELPCDALGAEDAEDADATSGGRWRTVSTSVICMRKESPVLREALASFGDGRHTSDSPAHAGAELWPQLARKHAAATMLSIDDAAAGLPLRVLPPHVFSPVPWTAAIRYFDVPDGAKQRRAHLEAWDGIRRRSHALRFWNRHTATLVPVHGSLMDAALNDLCVDACDEKVRREPDTILSY
eukprot:SM000930S24936  [mRNA]  locus=s930:590:1547:+ [translate_table: standard]